MQCTICDAALQNRGGGTLQPWAILDIDENIYKVIKKTIRIVDPFSIVKFECHDQF